MQSHCFSYQMTVRFLLFENLQLYLKNEKKIVLGTL